MPGDRVIVCTVGWCIVAAAMNGAERAVPEPASGGAWRAALGALGVLLLAVVLWGGYGRHWSWTGINGGTATLWDWLNLMMLPLALAVLPVWFSRKTRVHPRTKASGATVFAVFAIIVVLGYAVPLAWTGFRGNTLWDWINLVLLPVTLLAIPRLVELREGWGVRHSVVAFTVAAVFAALVLGGYLGSWGWTGFTGNTLWDWLHLLILPLLVPAVLVPVLKPIAIGRVVYLDADGNPIPEPAAASAAAAAESSASVQSEPAGLEGTDVDAQAIAGS
jgi:hypothetical protein